MLVQNPRGIKSCIAVESMIYSALVVDKAILVCILMAQMMGQPAKLMTKPVQDNAVAASSTYSLLQVPAKSALT